MNRFVAPQSVQSRLFPLLIATLWLSFGAANALAVTTQTLVTLDTRLGVTQKFILSKPDQPIASVILFAGGDGVLKLSQDASGNPVIGDKALNFVVRTRQDFVARGFMVAVVDAPSDHQGTNGMLGGFRASAEHAQDIAAVVAYMRSQVNLPVWLVGTSRGTESAANNAIRLAQDIGGLVLTSSVTVPNTGGPDVLSMNLEAIPVPVFVLAHAQDQCPVCPPSGAESIASRLTASPAVGVTILTGGLPPVSDPCDGSGSPHGFYGIESQAVDAIAAFIKSNSPMPKPMAPVALACAAAGGTAVSADWLLARPLGVTVSGTDAVVTLKSAAFTAAVDVYLVITIPDGQQFVMDAARRLLPFPANVAPLRANSLAALSSVSPPLISAPLAAIPPGSYIFLVVVVPAGTDPASFNPATSPYYLWCFTRSF